MLKKFAAFVFIMLLALPAMAEELSTKYFTVNMPDDWKVIMPPTENQGITSAVFAKNTSGVSVTMVVGPSSGADAKTIAGMFATQFKAEKPPVEKNGQYTFNFTQQEVPCQAWVAVQGDVFMVSSLAGNQKEALNFIKKNVKSADLNIHEEKFTDLLSEMTEVFESEDWILLADLLEYEFLPLCEEWQVVSEHLHEQMVKRIAQ